MYHIYLKYNNKVVNIFDMDQENHLIKYFVVPYLMNIQFQFNGIDFKKDKIVGLRIIETDEPISDIVKKINETTRKEKKWPIMRTKEIIIADQNFGNNVTDKIIEEAKKAYKKIFN
jgi:hypothetical protein